MDRVTLYNKRVLVTGGSGYLGRHLVSALKEEKATVFVIDKQVAGAKNEFEADITDALQISSVIKQIQPEITFHLAASLDRDRDFSIHDKVMKVNYNGTKNLLLALQQTEYSNFIFTSTSEIYGDNKAPFHEYQLPQPASVYSLSKLFSEELIQSYSRLCEKKFTILRLFNFIGKNMPENFFIPQLIQSLKRGETFKMTKGEQARDFLYIDDVIQALLLSAKKNEAANQVFNVCSGKSTLLKQLAKELKGRINGNGTIDFGALPYRKNEVWNMVGNNNKIKNMLGFTVQYEVASIIDKIITADSKE
jgi:nucleoside-diphosphate-sugar epimerase